MLIDRIDYNGDYEPSNCWWATWQEQGQNNRHTKLTAEAVIAIRQSAANGESFKSIARRFSVTDTAIGDVVKRITWRNVA